jgi:hypothetical protein
MMEWVAVFTRSKPGDGRANTLQRMVGTAFALSTSPNF